MNIFIVLTASVRIITINHFDLHPAHVHSVAHTAGKCVLPSFICAWRHKLCTHVLYRGKIQTVVISSHALAAGLMLNVIQHMTTVSVNSQPKKKEKKKKSV